MTTPLASTAPSSAPRPFRVRPYAPGDRAHGAGRADSADRAGVRRVSVETAWLGGPAPERHVHPELWADVFTRYFTDREPELTWVVERAADREICGYLTGTADVAALERFWLRSAPRALVRLLEPRLVLDRAHRRGLAGLARALVRGELLVPRGVRAEFPARFAFTLTEEARGHGLGPRLVEPFFEVLRARGVPGVHVQMLSTNEPAIRFVRRMGFQLAASWPLRAFEHLDPERVELLTWVLPLGRPGARL